MEKDLALDREKVNVNGGAIAIGSPRRLFMSLKDATRATAWAAPALAAARASLCFWKESDFSFAIVLGVSMHKQQSAIQETTRKPSMSRIEPIRFAFGLMTVSTLQPILTSVGPFMSIR